LTSLETKLAETQLRKDGLRNLNFMTREEEIAALIPLIAEQETRLKVLLEAN
jgi:hypothetical protein